MISNLTQQSRSKRKFALVLFAGLAMAQVCAGAASAQAPGRFGGPAVLSKQAESKQVQVGSSVNGPAILAQAIAAATLTKNGKAFPKLTNTTRATGGASCELYDTQGFNDGAAIDLEGGYHAKTSDTWPSGGPQEAIYSPPNADWVIQSYSRTVPTAGGTYVAADSATPPAFSMNTSSTYSSVVNTLHSYVLGLDIPDFIKVSLNAQISTFVSNIAAYSFGLSGSHGMIRHTGQVWGTGRTNIHVGHSWYHAHVGGTLTCAPAYLHDQAALTGRLKSWVNGVVANLPVSVSHTTPTVR